jgi:glycosyltransferase involved in cell wall biosynthesis
MIPYMGATLRRKRRQLSDASAVVAVSTAIARDLAQRAPELRRTRVEIIPNPVDVAALAEIRAEPPDRAADPYAIYVGKLAPNKGVAKLFAAIERAQLRWPLVVVGDGPDRAALERLGAAARVPVSFTGWLDRDDALAKLSAASLLVFPSHGPESLSRVLLEASALGVPIAAMDTGGTSDIVEHDVTGLLARSTDELGDAVAKLAGDPALRARLAAAARSKVAATFDTPRVVGRLEDLSRSSRRAGTSHSPVARVRRIGTPRQRPGAPPAPPERRRGADHPTANRPGRRPGGPGAGRRPARGATRPVPDVPLRGATRHDRPGSQHGLSAVR